jgi:thiol-disulfide isomerase/thioredoxin
VAVLIAVMLAVHAWQTRDLPFNEPAPATVLALLGGGEQASATTPGEAGVVYFFAPWCGVCRHSIDNLDALRADGTVAWATAVALDYGQVAEVREFVEETGIDLPVLLGDADTARDWSIRAFPTYFVIDSDGRITSRSVGYSTALGMRWRAWRAR